jgi:hypothetical protein
MKESKKRVFVPLFLLCKLWNQCLVGCLLLLEVFLILGFKMRIFSRYFSDIEELGIL